MMAYRSKKYELSASKINCFISCRRKYFLRYVENLVPIKTSQIMGEGSLFHHGAALMFDLMKKCGDSSYDPSFDVVAQSVRETAQEYELDEYSAESVVESLFAFCRSDIFGRLKVTETEKHVKTAVNGTHIHGYFDALGTVRVNDSLEVPVIVELKRRKQVTERVVQHTAYQYQPALYSLIAREMGIKNMGVLYLNMKACPLTPYVKTPDEDIKYKKDGEPYAWVKLEDESVREFAARVRQWYEECEDPVVHHLDRRNESQTRDVIKDIGNVKRDMVNASKRDSYYRNPNCCSVMPCEFASICLEDTQELRAGCFCGGNVFPVEETQEGTQL